MYCSQCGTEVWKSDNFCRACGAALADAAFYYPVKLSKFVFLSLVTWNIYPAYWFWKNYRYIRKRDKSAIIPWARAFFSPFWYYDLLRDIGRSHDSRPSALNAGLFLAFPYFLTIFMGFLPNPYWLLSFLSFVPLLPAVSRINALNGAESWALGRNSRLRTWHFVVTAVSLAAFFFLFATASTMIPGWTPIAGGQLWQKDLSFIESLGVLDDDESILLFYSKYPFSFRKDGNIVTDRQLISYTAAKAGGTDYWYASYDDILSVHIANADAHRDNTEIVVCLADDWFLLYAGIAGANENLLVKEIAKRIDKRRIMVDDPDSETTCEDSWSS